MLDESQRLTVGAATPGVREQGRVSRCSMLTSAGSILDISKYRDTCECLISILRYIEYRMIRRYLGDISYDPEYRTIRYLNNRRYGSIAQKL